MKVLSETQKITKATIEAAWKRRSKDQRLIVRDKECKGLALIVNATSMTWSYAYRPRGTDPATGKRWPNKTLSLGNPASLSPDDARNAASAARGQTVAGNDPVLERKAKLAADQKKRTTTLNRLVEEYEKALPKRSKMRGSGKPSSAYVAIEVAQVRLALQAMGATDTAVADLSTHTIRKFLDSGDAGSNAKARFGALSRFLDWCQDAGHIASNPCASIAPARRPKPYRARSHYLGVEQLAILWKAAAKLREPVWCDIARFLIAVPCRRSEAAKMDWAHVNLTAHEWRQHGRMTKNNEPHRLLLTPLVLNVLEARRLAQAEAASNGDRKEAARLLAEGYPKSGLIFPAPVSGKKIETFSGIKEALVEATKSEKGNGEALTGWTWHDFRRSFASALGEAGIPEVVADAVLNHRQAATRGGVLGVYQRSSRWPEQVNAMQLWGRLLQDALDGKQSDANVVAMVPRAS